MQISGSYLCKIIEELPSLTLVHHVQADGTVWASSKRSLLVWRHQVWEKIATFPWCWPRDLFGWFRPSARMFRSDKCNIFVNQAGKILGIRGMMVYSFSSPHCQPLFRIQGDCVLHASIAEDNEGWSYVGEYFMNPARQAVHIWKVAPDLQSWGVAYKFPAGSIRHIHTIRRDPFDPGTFWITVGDYGGECYLLRTDNKFRSLERFGDGTQIWRAVNLFFTENHVCWLTDSDIHQNYACRMLRASGQLEQGKKIDCSTWYGATTADGLHVAFTTIEKGPAIKTNRSSVLVSRDAFTWQEVLSFRKDFYRPVRLFKYGVICCPSGHLTSDNFFISGEGLVGLDGMSLRFSITETH